MRTILRLAAIAATVLAAGAAQADAPLKFSFKDASVVGKFGCKTKYPGSFRRGVTKECFSCPSGFKRNHPNPVGSGKECRRKGGRQYVNFEHRSKPKFGVRPCPGKPKYNPIANICYICPPGSKLAPTKKRCYKKVPNAYRSATFLGERGCPDGSFRNGLGTKCLSCPSGYVRAKLWGKTKKACVQVDATALLRPKWMKISKKQLEKVADFMKNNGDLIAALGRSAKRLAEAKARGVKIRDFRDPILAADLEKLGKYRRKRRHAGGCTGHPFLRPIQAIAFGGAKDGSTSAPTGGLAALGGNVTMELIWDFDAAGDEGAGFAFAVAATAGKGGEAVDAAAGMQVTAYFGPGRSVGNGLALVGEGGKIGVVGGAGVGADVSFSIGFDEFCPYLAGITVGFNLGLSVGVTGGTEADLGLLGSIYLPAKYIKGDFSSVAGNH